MKDSSTHRTAPTQKPNEPTIPRATVRIRLDIAFDGTAYQGWQWQRIGIGVQDKIQQAIHNVFRINLQVYGSSRTDTGVHALGMVAHVDLPSSVAKLPPGKLMLAINAHLPDDIRIMRTRVVTKNFHARFSASGKQYRYYVWNHPSHLPSGINTSWHVPYALDVVAMREAAALVEGTRDFRAFAVNTSYRKNNTIRTVKRCSIQKVGSLLTFVIEGDGFLYKMCRGIVGTIIQIGQGKFKPEDIPKMLACEDRRMAGMTAPAAGLTLWKVFYRKKNNPKADTNQFEIEKE